MTKTTTKSLKKQGYIILGCENQAIYYLMQGVEPTFCSRGAFGFNWEGYKLEGHHVVIISGYRNYKINTSREYVARMNRKAHNILRSKEYDYNQKMVILEQLREQFLEVLLEDR